MSHSITPLPANVAASPTPLSASTQPVFPDGSDTQSDSTVQETPAGHWAAIPLELVEEVLGRLAVADRRRVRRVCRSWCVAASRHLRCLHLAAEDPNRGQLARHLPSVAEVHLEFGSQPVPVNMMRRRLQALSPMPIQALHCDLHNLRDPAGDVVAAIVDELPNLNALGLKLHEVLGMKALQDVQDLVMAAVPYLVSIHMEDVPLCALARAQTLQALRGATGLRNLSTNALVRHDKMDQNDLQAIGLLTGLTSLKLQTPWAITANDLRCLTSLQELVSLRWVGLRYREDGPTTGQFKACMRAMLAAMPKLQHLEVDIEDDESDRYDAAIIGQHLDALKELRSLSLSEMYTLDTFRSLQQMPFLTKLELGSCYDQPKECMLQLARLTGLKALAIWLWSGDGDFVTACLPWLHNLQELTFSWSGNHPLPSLPHLTRLELQGFNLPDVCMLSIGSNLPGLRHLEVQAMTIEEYSVMALARCQQLEICKITGIKGCKTSFSATNLQPPATVAVSPALVAHLTTALPRLRLLEFPRLSYALVEQALKERPGNMPKAEFIELASVKREQLSQIRIQGD